MRKTLSLMVLLVVTALPLAASQFIEMPFDQVARESKYIVRAQVVDTWSAWDESREVIYTYATLRVARYFGEATGPDTLVVREVGGTVDGYTQQAVGFPAIRRGENVVLLLSEWENSTDLRIHAYNQGKFLVQKRMEKEVLVADPVKQGDAPRAQRHGGLLLQPHAEEPGLAIEEFALMVEDARAGVRHDIPSRRAH